MKNAMLAIAITLAALSGTASAQQSIVTKDLPDDARAVVSKEIARQRAMGFDRNASSDTGDADRGKRGACGDVNIGGNPKPTPNGRQNNTTVVTGSVVIVCN